MVRPGLAQLARATGRGLRSARVAPIIASPSIARASCIARVAPGLQIAATAAPARFISISTQRSGITPDDEPVKDTETPKVVQTPAEITDSEYHAVADVYLEKLVNHLEELAEKREDVDVEYSAGVLTVNFGAEVGTYVINKQPPNKQIWLSSPKSGPKRYDYVILGDGQQDKQDTACGEWMYLRDSSTMNQLFLDELGIDLRMPSGDYGE
ncbi:Frataxin-like domain-containing protein [Diplogelasinospora grovesii]|uniref:ferroxidase n=1 Tax=Diplogelasinospora grovesii TaxID=303347 RepID=A0AAN6N6E8_9PEZI|nr:Frataxin-like domain-containing protein [Diplogelasinospora grovesii]